MTAAAHASGEALEGEQLLVQILGDARDDDEQIRALHRAIEAGGAASTRPATMTWICRGQSSSSCSRSRSGRHAAGCSEADA